MKPFDLGTLVYIISAISLLFGCLMLTFNRINPEINGPIYWSFGSFCIMASSLLFTMEHVLNGFIAFVVSATFAISGIVLYWCGIRAFKDLQVKHLLGVGIALSQLIVSTLFYTAFPMPNARMASYSFIAIIACLICVWELKKPVDKQFRLAFNICLIVFIVTVITSSVRIYVILTTLPGDAYNPSYANLLVYFVTNVTQAMLIFSFMMMVSIKVSEKIKIKVEVQQKLFSIIAHDLSGPVGMINIMLNMANQENDFQEGQRTQFYKEAEKLSSSTNHLLQNLLYWTRNQIDDIKPITRKIDLNKLIVDNIELLAQIAHAKDIQIEYEPTTDIYGLADERMIDTVIRNLISNAIKFSYSGGIVKINSENFGMNVLLKISDNGIGMSDEVQRNLFEYKKIDSLSGTSGEKGTGLGLMLCKEFVERNDGILTINSKESTGAEIMITLPGA